MFIIYLVSFAYGNEPNSNNDIFIITIQFITISLLLFIIRSDVPIPKFCPIPIPKKITDTDPIPI